MALTDMLKDPETGKIKPVVLIGGAGIGLAGLFMLMSKGGSSGVTSPGQSGPNTDALSGLGSAILGLAGASGGGAGSAGSSGGSGNFGGGSTPPPPTGAPAVSPQATGIPFRTWGGPAGVTDPTTGITTIPKLGQATAVTESTQGILPSTSAISKPSNSGISSAPVTTNYKVLSTSSPTATPSTMNAPAPVFRSAPAPTTK